MLEEVNFKQNKCKPQTLAFPEDYLFSKKIMSSGT